MYNFSRAKMNLKSQGGRVWAELTVFPVHSIRYHLLQHRAGRYDFKSVSHLFQTLTLITINA